MAKSGYRKALPQVQTSDVFLGDVGIGTIMVHEWKVFPDASMRATLKDPAKAKLFEDYYAEVCDFVVNKCQKGLLLETGLSFKSSYDRVVNEYGLKEDEWRHFVRVSIDFCSNARDRALKDAAANGIDPCPPIVIGGIIGPKEGGYVMENRMTEEEAEKYHEPQVKLMAEQPEVDYIIGYTLPDPVEAIGIVRAAVKQEMQVVISFTLCDDGKLATGHTVKEAVEMVDGATGSAPVYYMLNCCHLGKVVPVFSDGGSWQKRIKGVRGNGSSKSHEELDESAELDAGDPAEYGALCREIQKLSEGNVNMYMGCCGTDMRHLKEVTKAITM